jgi:glucose-1-phosphate thymidylyltransferase
MTFAGYKGIILAGGTGTRLAPITNALNKHLLPVFDKPMIYFPLSTLMLSGIKEIAIITRPSDANLYRELLGNGENFGIELTYLVQDKPSGIPEAFKIASNFIGGLSSCLILGDNIFLGHGLGRALSNSKIDSGMKIFAIPVKNPSEYGVVTIDATTNKVLDLAEKPKSPVSNLAIPGIYFVDNSVISRVQSLQFSDRGELEIIDLLKNYLDTDDLQVESFPRGTMWMDAGTIESLSSASELVRVMQTRQGVIFGALEEIGWRNGWLSDGKFADIVNRGSSSSYYTYLKSLI